MRNEPTLPIATFMKYCIDMNAMEAMHATIIALLQLAGVKPHALCSTKSMSTAIICVRTCSTVALASHHLNPDFSSPFTLVSGYMMQNASVPTQSPTDIM